MTNKQATELIGKTITVKHKLSDDTWTICLKRRWIGTIFETTQNVFGIEQTTEHPMFNVYPVELVKVERVP